MSEGSLYAGSRTEDRAAYVKQAGDDGRHKRKASADRGPKSERPRLLGAFVNLVEQSRIQSTCPPYERRVVT